MGNKSLTALILTSLIIISLINGLQAVQVVEANFYMPPADTVWAIQSPSNSTYNSNYISLEFTVETNLGLLYFYSLDGKEKTGINTTTVSKVPLPEYPPFIDGSLWNRRTEQASTQLPYLPSGMHNLTLYQIYPHSKDNPQDGQYIFRGIAHL